MESACRQFQILISATIATFLLTASCTASAADGLTFHRERYQKLPAEQVALLEEFFDAYGKLKAFYADASLTARVSNSRIEMVDGVRVPSAQVKLERIVNYHYRALGSRFYRVDFDEFKPDGTTLTGSGVGVIRPEESFLLRRDPQSQKLAVIRHGKNEVEFQTMLHSILATVLPYSLGSDLLEYEIFTREDAAIVSVTVQGEGHDAIATIERRITVPEVGENNTRFELLRNQSWAVHHIDSVTSKYTANGLQKLNRYVQHCEYDPAEGKLPQLRTAVYEMYGDDETATDPPLWSRQTIEVTSFNAEPVAEADFDVSKMISKIDGIKERKSSFSWIIVANGIVLVVIGIVLARRSTAKKQVTPASPPTTTDQPSKTEDHQ